MKRWLSWSIVLVVIVISGGVLFAVTAHTHAAMRDIERLATINDVRVALERYYALYNRYPRAETSISIDARTLCASVAGWENAGCNTPVLVRVAHDPSAAYAYQYTANGETYTLDFYLEQRDTGWHRATPTGIQ